MVAYRVETAMVQIVRQKMTRHDDARSLLRAIYSLHPLANASSDIAVSHLCAEVNAPETLYPGTELRRIYESVSAQSP
jgi:hypothetical protein